MLEQPTAPAPKLSKAQRLWLLELGLDRPTLARLMPQRDAARPDTVTSTQASAQPPGFASHLKAGTPHGAGPATQGREPHVVAAAERNQVSSRDTAAKRAQESPAAAVLAALRQGRSPNVSSPRPAADSTRQQRADQNQHPASAKAEQATNTPSAFTPSSADPASAPASNRGVETEPALNDWDALNARIHACTACELHAGRFKTVAGSGATQAGSWLVVGEAPGDRDDRTGEPFQGKAGELLHAMLNAAGIHSQDDVFYTNLVKCRPRNNRPPTPQQIAACRPHLQQQAALLRPRGILTLGRLAAQALVADDRNFEDLRGQIHTLNLPNGEPIPVIVTYHPASLLSRPQHKAAAWRDLNLARALTSE